MLKETVVKKIICANQKLEGTGANKLSMFTANRGSAALEDYPKSDCMLETLLALRHDNLFNPAPSLHLMRNLVSSL
jgi:hypothetical protein